MDKKEKLLQSREVIENCFATTFSVFWKQIMQKKKFPLENHNNLVVN